MIRISPKLPIKFQLCFGILLALVACQPSDPTEETTQNSNSAETAPVSSNLTDAQLTELANQACDTLQKNLGSQLKAALEAGGPVAALAVCNTVAQPVTQSTSDSLDGINVTRTALKVRNPVNAPSRQDQSVLEEWEKIIESGATSPDPRLIHVNESESVFYRPIMIQEVCLKCHGSPESFPEELKTMLGQLYPKDQATGYHLGDLRGAFKVKMSFNGKISSNP